MDLGLNGKRALVTGASKGLGRSIAAELRAEGAEVAICARNEQVLRQEAHALGAHALPRDLSKPGAAASLIDDAIARLGGIDILVANTGGPSSGSFEAIGDDVWRSAFNDIFVSAVSLIRGCLPGMRERGWGRIMIVTSVSGREPLDNMILSNSIRPGLHGLLNSLSREVASSGITVNALMPGYTLTERLQELGVDERSIGQQIPARRMGRPEEFAALATFLASERASYICGQAIACDGGYLRTI